MLHHYLTLLINLMYWFSYIPVSLKYGTIITLHKGNGKRKDVPKNYRAITLSSSILKLYERILLKRLQNCISKPLHPLQGGFQKKMGSMMTSLIVKESIHFCQEKNSKLYTCFLDARQAFDRVWHDGLIYKLHQLGVNITLLKTVIAMHIEMYSRVLHAGHYSDWFPVLQGTRQGGVWSPFLYLCYINDLIDILSKSNLGLKISNYDFCSPSFADDI